MITYEVKISCKFLKSKLDRFIQGQYWWDVDAYINDSYERDLSECGWSKSLDKAISKTLKHILSAEKKIGEQFGVIIEVNGTAEEVTKELQ